MKSSLRYELDDYGKIGITLEEFDSLEQMDLFMQQFKDSNDVKEAYLSRINDFLKTRRAKEFLKLVKDKENNGYLRGYTIYNNSRVHVPIIYQSIVVPEEECIKRLRASLQNRSVLYDIYHRKPFLLPSAPTLFLRHELCHTIVHNGTNRIFIKEFISYIKNLNINEKYFVFRCLATNCHLLNKDKLKTNNVFKIRNKANEYELVKTKHYFFGDYSDEELHEMIKDDDKINLRDGVDNDFVIKDISELFEEYDLDEIDRNTDYFDNIGRKMK